MSYNINEDGRIVKEARINKGLTQQELAYKAGLHFSLISRIEGGSRKLSCKSKLRINKVLGTNFVCEDVPLITSIRIAKGFSLLKLSKILGIPRRTLSQIEHGIKEIPNKIIPKMNEVLGTNFEYRPELLGETLRESRNMKGYSQEEIAIAIKVSQETISNWELGVSKIPIKQSQKLITLLNIQLTKE